MKQFSLLEIVSTVVLLATVVVDLSRVFHAVDSTTLQVTHRCTPAPYGMLADQLCFQQSHLKRTVDALSHEIPVVRKKVSKFDPLVHLITVVISDGTIVAKSKGRMFARV